MLMASYTETHVIGHDRVALASIAGFTLMDTYGVQTSVDLSYLQTEKGRLI
jgi:hypothetical protein